MKKTKVIFILIVMLISYLIMAYIPQNNVYAAKVAAGTLTRDIDGIDDNLYPGYKQLIKNLQATHPNYTILLYYTGMDWNEALVTEYQYHGSSPLNLFQIGTNYNGKWLCPLCGDKKYDNGSWCCASIEALAYMMDPRNSINENDIFQFKDLEGSDVTYADIARVVANYGTYLNNGEAIQAIVDASNQYNINGYFLVAKIINEHGKNGSTLSNGNGYNGSYVGCYNYFNMGSYGNGTAAIINNGLAYAQRSGWTSIRASILGGAEIVKDKFIKQYSQNTLYYQKFNVSGKSALGSHQYQQNIMAAQSQGSSLKAYYGSTPSVSSFTFILPIYENMPQTPAPRPSATEPNTITYENGIVQNVSSSLKVRASANGTAIGALNNQESIKIIQRGTTQVGGYYWDLIVSNKNGTYGYAARNVGGEDCIVSIGTTGSNTGTATQQPENPPIDTPANGKDLNTDIQVINGCVQVLPDITIEDLKAKHASAIVKDAFGNEITTGNIATGYNAFIDGTNYKLVKKGDVNGDANVTILDAVLMLNVTKGTKIVDNEYKEAACVKNGTEFNITDVVLLLNYIKGTSELSFE